MIFVKDFSSTNGFSSEMRFWIGMSYIKNICVANMFEHITFEKNISAYNATLIIKAKSFIWIYISNRGAQSLKLKK